jgi:hypothetical protein
MRMRLWGYREAGSEATHRLTDARRHRRLLRLCWNAAGEHVVQAIALQSSSHSSYYCYAGFHDVGYVYLVFSTWGQHLDALSPSRCYYQVLPVTFSLPLVTAAWIPAIPFPMIAGVVPRMFPFTVEAVAELNSSPRRCRQQGIGCERPFPEAMFFFKCTATAL